MTSSPILCVTTITEEKISAFHPSFKSEVPYSQIKDNDDLYMSTISFLVVNIIYI